MFSIISELFIQKQKAQFSGIFVKNNPPKIMLK